MTREEKISKAAYSQYCNSESICFTMMCDSFKQGAKWADEHPKSPWISVEEDLPCNHKELISIDKSSENLTVTEYVVVVVYGYKLLSRMYELDGKWYWETDEPTHWFPIPEPLKE